MSCLCLGYKIGFLINKQMEKARQWAWQHDEQEEATKHRAEKKDEHIGRIKLFLHREISNMHRFLCMQNAIYVHVMCLVVIEHVISEGLTMLLLWIFIASKIECN